MTVYNIYLIVDDEDDVTIMDGGTEVFEGKVINIPEDLINRRVHGLSAKCESWLILEII